MSQLIAVNHYGGQVSTNPAETQGVPLQVGRVTPPLNKPDPMCNCASFLDPFPNQITWRSVSNLQHYCRVCNTQLNSCKQSRIHAEGKKHEKRLAYLKFCFENTGAANNCTNNAANNATGNNHNLNDNEKLPTMATPTLPTAAGPATPLLSQLYPSYLHYTATPTFYFPAQGYTFPDFVALSSPAPTAPPPTTSVPPPSQVYATAQGSFYTSTTPTSTPAAVPHTSTTTTPPTRFRGVAAMSGKSGNLQKKNNNFNKTMNSTGGSSSRTSTTSTGLSGLNCDLCSLTFPSISILHNHMKGSRHMRKVKSQMAYKQMKAAGLNFKETGDIQCEVCRVTVNSSHQLQAHLAGHKHKVRCYKRGLDPCAAMMCTSTPPSTAPSECSAARSSISSKKTRDPGVSTGGKPGLLGEYPVALRGLLPLPLPKLNVSSNRSANTLQQYTQQQSVKIKMRKQPRKAAKERRDSTTESDEATDPTCVKKELHGKDESNKPQKMEESSESTTPSTSSSCDKSSKANDFSSDEAKESEADSDKSLNSSGTSPSGRTESKPVVKHSCDICDISVNSATQLAQHMNSPKHHVKAAEVSQQGPKKSNLDNKPSKKLKEIPMLNMFLKTLQPPSQYYNNNQEKEADQESSSNTEVER